MATRHSFLSTTGLLRTPSSASSVSPSLRTVRRHGEAPRSNENKQLSKLKNLKRLNLSAKLHATGGVIPLGPTFIVAIAIVISLFFIISISFAFVGAEDVAVFKDVLNGLANTNPGILLIGDNVDVDVDEPAVTVRWSIIACGSMYTLAGSEGTHGSSACGIPNIPLNIYVDGEETPTATYDPNKIPTSSTKSNRLSVQNLYQFDSDHVLDVHEARLYPFDTYTLTSNIRIETTSADSSAPIEVIRLLTISDTASFIITPNDTPSTVSFALPSSAQSGQSPSRDVDLIIRRPGEARFFALLLFGINWMLAHATVGYVALACKASGSQRTTYYLILCVVTMLVIPQVRGAMPDAPGYDGVLIDQIGFFSQMVLTGASSLILLALLARRELAHLEQARAPEQPTAPLKVSESLGGLKGPKASIDFRHIRSLSKKFLTRLEPPSPISEHPDAMGLLDPFAAAESPTGAYGMGRPAYTPRVPAGGPRNGSSSLAPPTTTYSSWV